MQATQAGLEAGSAAPLQLPRRAVPTPHSAAGVHVLHTVLDDAVAAWYWYEAASHTDTGLQETWPA